MIPCIIGEWLILKGFAIHRSGLVVEILGGGRGYKIFRANDKSNDAHVPASGSKHELELVEN